MMKEIGEMMWEESEEKGREEETFEYKEEEEEEEGEGYVTEIGQQQEQKRVEDIMEDEEMVEEVRQFDPKVSLDAKECVEFFLEGRKESDQTERSLHLIKKVIGKWVNYKRSEKRVWAIGVVERNMRRYNLWVSEEKACLKIQSWWRGCLSFRTIKKMKNAVHLIHNMVERRRNRKILEES